jgi:hypothetical protein
MFMKFLFFTASLLLITISILAQNVGVNTASPLKRLSVNGSLLVDQNNTNLGTLDSASLSFGTTGAGVFSNKNPAVTNLNGLDFWTSETRRMTISSSGLVGINLGTAAPLYVLDVNGSIRTKFGLIADNSLTVANNASIGGNASIAGNITIDGTASVGGKGIVRSNSATNLRMGFTSGGYVITLSAGGTVDIVFNITPFVGTNSNVRVSICQFVPNLGSGDTWGRITMTVHSVDEVANQCKIRFYNGSSASATMDGVLYLMSVATD